LGAVTKLNVGSWVQVKSAEEITAGLDESGSLDGLPFMPEMLQHCGERFRVFKSAHKTHDTIDNQGIRRMANAVHLDGLRCDGSYHGGCQAGCLLFWKKAWLEPIGKMEEESVADDQCTGKGFDQKTLDPSHSQHLVSGAVYPNSSDGAVRYRCQATEMLNATANVRRRERWDPRFYIRDVTSKNVSLWNFIRFGALATLNALFWKCFKVRYPRIHPHAAKKTPTCELDLQPGELIRVKSKGEIEKTLNKRNRNRGMSFDVEMLQFCEREYRVLSRVETILDEKTGEIIHLANPSIILDGVTCTGNYLRARMFSPRNEYPFWREIWLERVSEAPHH
jgi:hypothetical protein